MKEEVSKVGGARKEQLWTGRSYPYVIKWRDSYICESVHDLVLKTNDREAQYVYLNLQDVREGQWRSLLQQADRETFVRAIYTGLEP